MFDGWLASLPRMSLLGAADLPIHSVLVPFHSGPAVILTCMDDGDHGAQATRNDPRVTRVGARLRHDNIDELPQLLHVIQGRLSLVGPSPHALAHDREHGQKIGLYARRHTVKPGITGWAQVRGLRSETDTDDKMTRRVSCHLWSIDN